jgi:protocatechuate 3,4-dioxygenase beta subunit
LKTTVPPTQNGTADAGKAFNRERAMGQGFTRRAALCFLTVLAAIAPSSIAEPAKTPDKPPTFTGHVVAPDGKPVAGADVSLLDAVTYDRHEPLATARTDAGGQFTLTAARPADATRSLTIVVGAPGLGLTAANAVAGEPMEITLSPATTIRVTFLDPEGKPASGVPVEVKRIVTSEPGRMFTVIDLTGEQARRFARTTDGAGAVTFDALPERASLQLDVGDDRFARVAYDQFPRAGDAPSSPPTTVRLKAASEVSGTVTYGPDGRPAAGVRVLAGTNHTLDPRGTGWGEAVTDAEGRYRMRRLEAGHYNVVIHTGEIPDHAWTAAGREGVQIKVGETLASQNFVLVKGAIITGRVIRADTGKGLPDISVGLYGPAHPRSSGMIDGARTDADGRYRLRTPAGASYVYIAQQAPDGYDVAKPQDVTVVEGRSVTVDFKLPRRPGKPVFGRVLDPDGKPVEGAYVSAERKDGDMMGGTYQTTDAEGNFRFEAIGPGTLLRAGRGARLETPLPTPVDGGEADVTLTLAKAVRVTLTGLVVDDDGKPVKGARVQLITMQGKFGMGGQPEVTDAEGRYRFKGLKPDGRYTLQVETDNRVTASASVPVTLVPGDETSSQPPIRVRRYGK